MKFSGAGNGTMVATIDRLEIDLRELFALNVLLQLVDGLLTYRALQIGLPEGNPLIIMSMAALGPGSALLLFKANACGLLLVLRRYVPPLLGVYALRTVALGMVLLAVVPWVGKYLAFAAA